MPASKPSVRARYATAGVGTTPALTTVAPSLVNPRASSSSIQVPDSRVSRPITKRVVFSTDLKVRRCCIALSDRGADARHRLRFERRRAGLAADAISTE